MEAGVSTDAQDRHVPDPDRGLESLRVLATERRKLARGYLDSDWPGDEMQEILQQASDTTGETAALFVRNGIDRVCIAVARRLSETCRHVRLAYDQIDL